MKSTKNQHIKQVDAGETIQDFTIKEDGYVWFDEVGLVCHKVYHSFKEAETSLKRYVEEVLNGN